jgi:hypothetical protein
MSRQLYRLASFCRYPREKRPMLSDSRNRTPRLAFFFSRGIPRAGDHRPITVEDGCVVTGPQENVGQRERTSSRARRPLV